MPNQVAKIISVLAAHLIMKSGFALNSGIMENM